MKNKKSVNERLLELEKSLKTKLHPVIPDRKFVGHLRKRLEDSTIYQNKKKLAATLLSVAAGLTIGLVIFLIGVGFLQEGKKA